jgi:hypothetical protein
MRVFRWRRVRRFTGELGVHIRAHGAFHRFMLCDPSRFVRRELFIVNHMQLRRSKLQELHQPGREPSRSPMLGSRACESA